MPVTALLQLSTEFPHFHALHFAPGCLQAENVA